MFISKRSLLLTFVILWIILSMFQLLTFHSEVLHQPLPFPTQIPGPTSEKVSNTASQKSPVSLPNKSRKMIGTSSVLPELEIKISKSKNKLETRESRLRRMERVCKRRGELLKGKPTNLERNLIVSIENGLAYCRHGKVFKLHVIMISSNKCCY